MVNSWEVGHQNAPRTCLKHIFNYVALNPWCGGLQLKTAGDSRDCVLISPKLIRKKWLLLHCMKANRRKQIVNREFRKFHPWHLQPPVCCDCQNNFFTKKSINSVLISQTDERFSHNSWESQSTWSNWGTSKVPNEDASPVSSSGLRNNESWTPFTWTLWLLHLM